MPFLEKVGIKKPPHSSTTQGAFKAVVDKVPRPSSLSSKDTTTTGATPASGFTRLFQGREFQSSDYSDDTRPSQLLEFEDDVVVLRAGPGRSVAANTRRAAQHSSQKAKVNRDVAQPPPVPSKHLHSHLKYHMYPQSIEDLYVSCGIVMCEQVDNKFPANHNLALEAWTLNNPVAAAHIMGLAKQWGLRAKFSETIILTDSSLWKRTAPAHRERELKRSLAEGDKWVDEQLTIVGRHVSNHVVQKQGLHNVVKDMAYGLTREQVFATSDLTPPKRLKGEPMTASELPYPVLALYCDMAGVKLDKLSLDKRDDMMLNWLHRYPVSDYHLKRVIEDWSPEVKKIDIDPAGYQSLKSEIGSTRVDKRARALSNVTTDGRRRSPPRWRQEEPRDPKSLGMETRSVAIDPRARASTNTSLNGHLERQIEYPGVRVHNGRSFRMRVVNS